MDYQLAELIGNKLLLHMAQGLVQKIRYGVYKKLHDNLDQVDKVRPKLVKFVNLVMQFFCDLIAKRESL